jgi:hypothetical protein
VPSPIHAAGHFLSYAKALSTNTDATMADLREAVTTLEDAERTARRVLGSAHPRTTEMEAMLREAQAALLAVRGTPRRN